MNLRRHYDRQARRLVYIDRQATPDFWDERWEGDHLGQRIRSSGVDSLVLPTTRRYLSPGSLILEGGCGDARYVYALRQAGYRCLGLDFAARTLHAVHREVPELPLVLGDVFSLPLPDGGVDGYWSMGVIEHFWSGYQPILAEMRRVLRPGGVLFLTHPYLNPLRRLKAAAGRYEGFVGQDEPPGFYQFALDAAQTRRDVEAEGFALLQTHGLFGDHGLSQELPLLQPLVQALAGRPGLPARVLRGVLDRAGRVVSGHSILQVYRAR